MVNKQICWDSHEWLRETGGNGPERRRQHRCTSRQHDHCNRQAFRHIVHCQTCRNKDTKLASMHASKTNANADSFRKGMKRHDKENEEGFSGIRSTKSTDFEVLVSVQ